MFKKMAQYDSALTYYIQLVTLAESKAMKAPWEWIFEPWHTLPGFA